ncbi:hypothetical protein [Flavihumibacter sp. UBA7668]|uniref:hypothetical protein n=1 Tax=Flavihumibacter sp. UBA7668 TaxID=1946542 RepID=UPI0025BEE46A|nr:hypothetical protein [Flavihumibacter sp. UBA7668]
MLADDEFKYADLKNFALMEADKLLSMEGFKLVKSQLSFKKTIQSGRIEVAFDFLNYYPTNYEYSFGVIIWINALQEITLKFYEFAGIKESIKWSTGFFEGDFIDSLRNSEYKFRTGYYNEVRSLAEARNSMNATLDTLKNKAIPLAYLLCELKGFQEYYSSNKHEIVKNFGNNALFISILLAMCLRNETEFFNMANYLRAELDREKAKGNIYEELYFYLDRMSEFVKSKS